MKDFLDEFYEDFFTMGFGKPKNVTYNSGRTQDLNPVFWNKTDFGYKATCRTVGINEDDVLVEVKDGFIKVSGKTEYEGSKYNVSYEIPISNDIISNIKKIEYKSLNGLTYIYIFVDRPENKTIKAVKIK